MEKKKKYLDESFIPSEMTRVVSAKNSSTQGENKKFFFLTTTKASI